MNKLSVVMLLALLLVGTSLLYWQGHHRARSVQSLPAASKPMKCPKQGFDWYLGSVVTNGSNTLTVKVNGTNVGVSETRVVVSHDTGAK
jgi:hypothetical protein